MTWSSSLNHCGTCNRSWSSGRPTWKQTDFASTWTKPKFWYLGWGSMCFRSLSKTNVACVSRASAQIPFSVVLFRLNPQEMQWCPCLADASFGRKRCTGQAMSIDGRLMVNITVYWEKFDVVPSFCYLGGLLILRWRLWTRYYCNMPWRMEIIQWAPVRPHLPLIPPSPPEEQFTARESGVHFSVQAKPGPQP